MFRLHALHQQCQNKKEKEIRQKEAIVVPCCILPMACYELCLSTMSSICTLSLKKKICHPLALINGATWSFTSSVLHAWLPEHLQRLRKKLETIFEASGGKKVDIVSHSMGGLLVMRCSRLHHG